MHIMCEKWTVYILEALLLMFCVAVWRTSLPFILLTYRIMLKVLIRNINGAKP